MGRVVGVAHDIDGRGPLGANGGEVGMAVARRLVKDEVGVDLGALLIDHHDRATLRIEGAHHDGQLRTMAQDEHMAAQGVTALAHLRRLADVLEEIGEHADEQGREEKHAQQGKDETEPVVGARSAKAARVEKHGHNILPNNRSIVEHPLGYNDGNGQARNRQAQQPHELRTIALGQQQVDLSF